MSVHGIVGGKNEIKLQATQQAALEYPLFKDARIEMREVKSGVDEQPMGLTEIIKGASNRAKAAFELGCDYGFGIESGLFEPGGDVGLMNICACSIYDGKRYAVGLSSAFELPSPIVDLVLEKGMTVREASLKCGFTDNPNIAHEVGNVGLLTRGRVNRDKYTKHAIRMAMIKLEYPEWYRRHVICSTCSREKAEGYLPARKMYLGTHVRKVAEEAEKLGRSFYILSGVFGLIAGGEVIGAYDHLLTHEEAPSLARAIAEQIRIDRIDEITFYAKKKPAWQPYLLALTAAAQTTGIDLHVVVLADND